MDEQQIKHMVGRFLAWPLPEGFNPDGGITFDPVGSKGTPHEFKRQPVGTNLLTAIQATAMVRHMLEGLPAAPAQADAEQNCMNCAHDGGTWHCSDCVTNGLGLNGSNWEPKVVDISPRAVAIACMTLANTDGILATPGWQDRIIAVLRAQRGKIADLETEAERRENLRWNADMRAIKRWQATHPGNELVWPDHADLCSWLLGELDNDPLGPLLVGASAWVHEAAKTIVAYGAECGFPMDHDHEIGRIDESRDRPSFRIRVGHIIELAEALKRREPAAPPLMPEDEPAVIGVDLAAPGSDRTVEALVAPSSRVLAMRDALADKVLITNDDGLPGGYVADPAISTLHIVPPTTKGYAVPNTPPAWVDEAALAVSRDVVGLIKTAQVEPDRWPEGRLQAAIQVRVADEIQAVRKAAVGVSPAATQPVQKMHELPEPPLTASMLADVFGCVWNAAIGAAHDRQGGLDHASILAATFAAMQRRLEEIAATSRAAGKGGAA